MTIIWVQGTRSFWVDQKRHGQQLKPDIEHSAAVNFIY